MPTGMKVLIGGLLALLVATIVLELLGFQTAAWAVGTLGTWLFMMAVLLWAAAWDSRRRWPGEPFMQRLGSILTFRRD